MSVVQGFESAHGKVPEPTQEPPAQTSIVVQTLPSLHDTVFWV